jgi:hypothetical protein
MQISITAVRDACGEALVLVANGKNGTAVRAGNFPLISGRHGMAWHGARTPSCFLKSPFA